MTLYNIYDDDDDYYYYFLPLVDIFLGDFIN